MIYINRPPEPGALKVSRNYRHDDVVNSLKIAFYNRCYLCEDSPQVINVEHLVPWSTNHALKILWSNLFWSCGHCNNIKGDTHVGILDCTTDVDVEKKLIYRFSGFPAEDVSVVVAPGWREDDCLPTANLLLDIFNGTTTIKRIESNSLRRRIAKAILNVYSLIQQIDDVNISPEEKENVVARIKTALGVRALFASFTRSMIRENAATLAMLKREIPDLDI